MFDLGETQTVMQMFFQRGGKISRCTTWKVFSGDQGTIVECFAMSQDCICRRQ